METKQVKKLDIREEETRIWSRVVNTETVDQFCLDHNVKITSKDGMFDCYIDGIFYTSMLTSFGALYRGIHEYRTKNAKNSSQ